MTLKAKFKQWLDTNPNPLLRETQLEIIAEDFAIEFAKWMVNKAEKYNEYLYEIQDFEELLEIFKKDGTYKADYEDIAVGRSLLMSPFSPSFTWRTTLVTDIIEQREGYIKFNTENSTYELFENYENT